MSTLLVDTSRSAIQPFLLTTTDAQAEGRKPVENSSTEFNPWTMVPPPVIQKSGIITPPGSNRSSEPSSSSSSSTPLISYDPRIPSPPRSADNNSAHYRDTSTDRDQHRRHLDGAATSQVNSLTSASENIQQAAPLQHVDSGIRAAAVGADAFGPRVELPPVYSQS